MNLKIFALLWIAGSSSAFAGTIEQTIQFDGVTSQRIFDVFTNPKEHEMALGKDSAPVSIGSKVGAKYTAFSKFGGGLTGKVIAVNPGKQVVLSWRMPKYTENDPDSVVTFLFSNNEKGAQIEMVHAGVPDSVRGEVNTHWNTFYWDTFRPYVNSHKKL